MKFKEDMTSMGRTYYLKDQKEERYVVAVAEGIVKEHKLDLEVELMPLNILSRGVQGDEPTYGRVITLKGEFPGKEVLSEISSKISNKTPINRIMFDFDF